MSSPLGLMGDLKANYKVIGGAQVTGQVLDPESIDQETGQTLKKKEQTFTTSKRVKSIFSDSYFSPYPRDIDLETGNVKEIKSRKDLHSDDHYDISI